MKTHLLFKTILVVSFLSFFSLSHSQIIIETFDNNDFTTTIGSGSYVGDGGIVWNYTNMRSHTYAPPNVGDVMYGACYVNTSAMEAVYPNGIGYVTFKARSWNSTGNAIFEVRVNDTIVGTFDLNEVTTDCAITNLGPLPNDTLRIQKIGGSTRGTIDDIEVWETAPVPSDDKTLSSLSNSGGSLVPAFDSGVLTYDVELIWGSTLTPLTTAVTNEALASAVITDAADVTSGVAADRTTSILVTAEDATQQTYEILFSIAAPSSDATLSSLASSEGSLTPSFDAGTFAYTVDLPYAWSVTPIVSAVTNHAGGVANVTNATDITSGVAADRTTTVLVTAQDASTETYTIEFNASAVPSTDATLRSLTASMGNVTPTFSSATLSYEMLLPMGTLLTPVITAVPNHDSATVAVIDAIDITSGTPADRTSTVVVTAQDGSTTETYTVLFEVSLTVGGGEVKWIHTTFGNDPKTQIYVSWATELAHDDTYVLYGIDDSYGMVENANIELVKFGDIVGNPMLDTLLIHHVLLTGLTPGTEYHYKCGGSAGLGTDCRFKTAPAGTEKFSFAVMADPQQRYNYNAYQDTSSRYLSRQGIDFWIPLGDLMQEGGETEQWNTFFNNCKALFESTVIAPIIGNHDLLGDPDAIHYTTVFRFPDNNSPGYKNLWYKFEYSNASFYNLDIYPPTGVISTVENPWFHDKLNVDTKPWKFAAWHNNPYSTGGHGGDGIGSLLTSFLSEISTYNVNAVFNGHSHHYEVTHPISVIADPPTISPASVNGSADSAWATTSQGTIFYNGAGFGGGLAKTLPAEPFTLDERTNDNQRGMTLIATINMDTMIYDVTYCRDSPPEGMKGDLKFTYIVVNDTSTTIYTLTSSSAGNGYVTPSGANIYYENDDAILTAIPDAGYAFNNWTGNVPVGEENSNPLTITMTADAAVTANFVILPTYTLTVNSGTGSSTFYETEQTSVSADTPPVGQKFDAWTGDVSAVADINSSITTVTMPSANVTITATYVPLPTYTLIVTNGTGSGDYLEASSVGISPDAPPTGQEFNVWTGDISYLDNANIATAIVTMPALAISLTATYRDTTIATYTLTITNGTGSGDYVEAAVVPIVANTPPVGQMFYVWTGDVTNVTDVNSSTTTISMPASNSNITATYVDIPTYTLTVTNGTGSGDYLEAAVVPIVADASLEGYRFDAWTGDVANVTDVNDSSTTITMLASAVSITATYVSTGSPTYNVTFTIDDGSSLLSNATVSFNSEVKLSNASGKVTFSNVSSGTNFPYTVVLSGYDEYSSQLTVVDADVNESVSMTTITGINDAFANIEIYPNPASDKIHIKNIENILYVNIYSISNVLVKTYHPQNKNEMVMDVSNLSKGMYFIELVANNGRVTKQQVIF